MDNKLSYYYQGKAGKNSKIFWEKPPYRPGLSTVARKTMGEAVEIFVRIFKIAEMAYM